MRASTVAAILVAAAAASPAFAAPHYARSNAAELLLARQGNHVARSEPVYHFARQDVSNTDASGAFNLLNTLKGALSFFLKRELSEREVVEILARQDVSSTDASGAFNLLNTLKGALKLFFRREFSEREIADVLAQKREFDELMAREDFEDLLARQNIDPNDASGAGLFSIITKVAGPLLSGIFGGGSNKREIEEFFAREDIQDLLARQNVDLNDASGAGLFSFIPKIIGPILGGFLGGNNNNRREIEEFFAREDIQDLLARQSVDINDASGAGLFSFIPKLVGPLLGGLLGGNNNNRREIEEFFAREDIQDLLARQSVDLNDASGAGLFSFIPKLVGPLLGGLLGGNNNNRREIEEFFAREDIQDLLARQNVDLTDASGAGLFSFIPKIIGPILGGFLGGNNNNRREIEEFFAREDIQDLLARQNIDPNDASGAGLFSIITKVAGPLLSGLFGGNNNKREEFMELLARQNVDINDASGASFLSKIFKGFLPAIDRREFEELMARQSVDPNDASGAGLFSIITKIAGPILGGLFGGGNNNRREFLEAFARELENSARSLNELD